MVTITVPLASPPATHQSQAQARSQFRADAPADSSTGGCTLCAPSGVAALHLRHKAAIHPLHDRGFLHSLPQPAPQIALQTAPGILNEPESQEHMQRCSRIDESPRTVKPGQTR
ncbi:hypothetical protein Stsp01_66730 [Streptomyces sp. NBRC 13847]|nr:hypothetical protein Stsp01_66730 [Streptomyces sp. NBRC 13847]